MAERHEGMVPLAINAPEGKRCRRCGEVKPCSAFYRNRTGLASYCKSCTAEVATAWRAAHPDRAREISRGVQARRRRRDLEAVRALRRRGMAAAYRRDPAKFKARARAWSLAHPERVVARRAIWRAANRESVRLYHRAYRQVRRAREVGAPGSCSPEQLAARIAYYGGLCYLCRAPAASVDHVIPLARGGSNWPSNLRPACRRCNSRKGVRALGEVA